MQWTAVDGCLYAFQVKPGRKWTDVLLRGDMVAWLVDMLPSLSAAHSLEAAASPLAVNARMLLERLAGLAGDVFPKAQHGVCCMLRVTMRSEIGQRWVEIVARWEAGSSMRRVPRPCCSQDALCVDLPMKTRVMAHRFAVQICTVFGGARLLVT